VTVNVEVMGNLDPFDYSPEGRTTIQLPWYNEEVAGYFWPAVNAPTYADSAVKTSELVNYVYDRAYQEGVRSILGRDS
jgi:hypothetical protein